MNNRITNNKLFGGILLIVGTTIGAGILALPIATAQLGFIGSTLLLIFCWAVMTACAFLFLEVNLWLPPSSNLISMAGATLGRPGQVVAWIFYLLLLYSILCAYIAGGGDLFHYLLSSRGIDISFSWSAILFTALLGSVVYFGIRSVDYVNRGLMFGKLGAFILLVALIFPFVSVGNLSNGEFSHISSSTSIMVTVVAFTCLMIIPSLRTYFDEDVKSLRKAILIGTLVPLVCYIAWDMVIMGVVPLEGQFGLIKMLHSSSSNSDLVTAISTLLQKNTVTLLAKFFTSICMATSFLSIALCLSDFLSDGLRINKQGFGNVTIFAITFLPPILVVLFYPDAFIGGLKYAGICCFVLMILLPPLMVWRGRYHQKLALQATHTDQPTYQVPGGKFLLVLLLIFATLMIGFGVKGIF